MANKKRYNIFILISMFARNIVEVFSSVILYEKGFTLKDILLFYSILYVAGILVSIVSLYLGKKIKQKNILIISSIIYGYCFYYLKNMPNTLTSLITYAIILAIGSYSYHTMRHYFALEVLPKDNQKDIGNILICNYIALIISSYLGGYITKKLGLSAIVIIVIITSLISLIPLWKVDNPKDNHKIIFNYKGISKNKIWFFILEQFKVIFLSLQPLYLYIYTKSNIEYIGIFNAILAVASIIFMYFISRKLKIDKYFITLNTIFCLILILKINITNSNILLLIAFFEGIFTKMYEIVSATNIYHKDYKDVNSYLILCETIFCGIRAIICLLLYFFIKDIRIMLYICILGIFISSFVRYPHKIKTKSIK